jgi:hypothetical protein
MKGTKAFDCLGMKRALQAKLHKQWAGLTTAQIQAAITADLASSQTDLAKWWRKIEKGRTRSAASRGQALR